MDNYELQKLRDLPIEGVAERLGLQVTRHRCLCPFHDDHHPSLTFKKNKYRCWSCGASGDVISLVMNCLHKPFLEATKWLGLGPDPSPVGRGENFTGSLRATGSSPSGGGWEGAFYERFFARPWLSEEAWHFLFDERRLDPRVVRWCRLTSWKDKQGVPWLQTPYYDREGRLIGVQNRNLVKGGLPRFRFPSGSECSIYNLPVLNMLKPGEALYITEGCSDCWAMLSAGHKAIAIPSATLLSKKDIELLKSVEGSGRLDGSGGKKASPTGGGLEGGCFSHVPRQRPARRAAFPAAERGAARPAASSAASGMQGLQRVLFAAYFLT